MADLPDDELMALYRDGAPEAFEELFERYRAPVYNYARSLLADATAAEDVMQETFLAVARTANEYEPRGRFRAWVMRITRNRCLNRLSSESLQARAVRASAAEVARPSPADPIEAVALDEWQRAVRDAIGKLPERQREAIVLYAFEDMSYREISEVLGMPINTVKTLIHRARAALALVVERHTK